MNVLMKLEGGEQLRRALKRVEKDFIRELGDALPAEGQTLMSAANALAPVATGELVNSSSVTSVVQESKGRVRVAAAYLDEKAPAVHEGIHGGAHVPGTRGFKWYERALNAFEGGFTERIAAKLRALTGGAQ